VAEDYDYTRPCNADKPCSYNFLTKKCTKTKSCTCPDPLPNSHLVYSDCQTPHPCSYYDGDRTGCLNNTCQGTCYYKCDEGYYWDGEACVPIPTGTQPINLAQVLVQGGGFVKRYRNRRRKKMLLV